MCNASPVKHKYLVRDSAACFLIDYNEAADNWQVGDRFLTEYLEKNPEVSSTLLNTSQEHLNAADLQALASPLCMGRKLRVYRNQSLKRRILRSIDNRCWNRCWLSQNNLNGRKWIRFGHCERHRNSPERLLSGTGLDIVASGISFYVMGETQKRLNS